MKIFIGSSNEAIKSKVLDNLASIIENAGHQPILWTDSESFIAGDSTIENLLRITDNVDATILVFTEDDKTWRNEAFIQAPRDNVVFELGLFMGRFRSSKKAIIVKMGKANVPSDLAGLTYINFTEGKQRDGKIRIENWLSNLVNSDIIVPSVEDYYKQTEQVNNLGFYIENDRRNLSFSTSDKYKGLLNRKYLNNFTVVTHKKSKVDFKLVFFNEFILPEGITDLKSVINFSIKSKNRSFSIDDCDISTTEINGKKYGRIRLTEQLEVSTGTVFTIDFESLVQEYVNIETFSARYPTKGLSLSLEYSNKYHYDHQYFKANTFLNTPNSDLDEFLPSKENGIHTSTNDWFVIGEGMAVSWFPK